MKKEFGNFYKMPNQIAAKNRYPFIVVTILQKSLRKIKTFQEINF